MCASVNLIRYLKLLCLGLVKHMAESTETVQQTGIVSELFHYPTPAGGVFEPNSGCRSEEFMMSVEVGQGQQKAWSRLLAATKLIDHVREPRIPLVST